jgi:hypothetical protein
MFGSYRFAAIFLLLISDCSQAFAETIKFPLGYVWYVSCSKIDPSEPLPGRGHVKFGFSDDREYHYDLIVGPVTSDAETVKLSYLHAYTHDTLRWSLSRATGVLTITNESRALEAKYTCEKWSPWSTF